MTAVDEVPKAHTPAGGYGTTMPPPVLLGCAEPLVPGAPDLRGTWRVVELEVGGAAAPPEHPAWAHVERIEQAADRLVVTGGGVVHDMLVDGTAANGVNDVMAADFTTPISVAASFEDEVLVLRPEGLPGVEVRRWRDGEHLRWSYAGAFEATLERIDR
ncbi:hypothetical protein B7486_58350 [cyanobacterium TDX16]|nr:hypothetical protein B7486_58350 [cyanobacterium TDX16]